jgi:uncharacterized protein YdaU (DUF1376 family)
MSAPYMPFYIGDYIKKTRHLTTEQHGAYLLLIFSMFSAGGSLPNDDRKLARIAGLSNSKWASNRGDLLEFFDVDGDTITHSKITEVSKKYNEKISKLAANGAKGGAAKALKDLGTALANATILPCQPEPEPELSKKEIDKSISKARRKSRIKPDWCLTDQDWEYARSKGLQQKEIENEEGKFREWYLLSGAAWLDWGIVWKRWVGRCVERNSNQGRGQRPTPDRQEPVSRADIAIRRIKEAQSLRDGG